MLAMADSERGELRKLDPVVLYHATKRLVLGDDVKCLQSCVLVVGELEIHPVEKRNSQGVTAFSFGANHLGNVVVPGLRLKQSQKLENFLNVIANVTLALATTSLLSSSIMASIK